MKEFTGSLERIIYYNGESSSWWVACAAGEGDYLCWEFPTQIEEELKLTGSWQVHRRYGRQLAVERWNASSRLLRKGLNVTYPPV